MITDQAKHSRRARLGDMLREVSANTEIRGYSKSTPLRDVELKCPLNGVKIKCSHLIEKQPYWPWLFKEWIALFTG